jgi:hypothetical protein
MKSMMWNRGGERDFVTRLPTPNVVHSTYTYGLHFLSSHLCSYTPKQWPPEFQTPNSTTTLQRFVLRVSLPSPASPTHYLTKHSRIPPPPQIPPLHNSPLLAQNPGPPATCKSLRSHRRYQRGPRNNKNSTKHEHLKPLPLPRWHKRFPRAGPGSPRRRLGTCSRYTN